MTPVGILSNIGPAIATTRFIVRMSVRANVLSHSKRDNSREPRHSNIGQVIATRMRFVVLLSGCAILLLHSIACHTPATSPYHEQLVVRAYLYAGKPVTDIELTGTVSLISADTVGPPISDAVVSLTKRGVRYALSADPSRAGYYGYAGSDLAVAVGDTFDLTVTRRGDTATSQAIVPPPPTGLSLSRTELTVGSGALGSDSSIIIVRWSNPHHDYFFAVVTPLDTSAGKIPTPGGGVVVSSGSVVFPPTQSDSTIIAPPQLHYYGRQRVDLYRVPPAYAALYIARQQDSRDLNEPPTNIHGGLGIFSAFAGDSAFFDAHGG